MGSTHYFFGGKRKKKNVGAKKEKEKKFVRLPVRVLNSALHAFPAFQYSIPTR